MDNEGEEEYPVQVCMLEALVANNALTIYKHINIIIKCNSDRGLQKLTIQILKKVMSIKKGQLLYPFFKLLTQSHDSPAPKLTDFHICITLLPLNVTLIYGHYTNGRGIILTDGFLDTNHSDTFFYVA